MPQTTSIPMKMENKISLWTIQTLVNMSLCVYMHMYGMKYCKNSPFLSFQSRMKWCPGQTVYTTTQTSQQPRTPRRMVSVCLYVLKTLPLYMWLSVCVNACFRFIWADEWNPSLVPDRDGWKKTGWMKEMQRNGQLQSNCN